ncbi:hypothetical protein ACP4OV_023512 [Aristida adscensionis]
MAPPGMEEQQEERRGSDALRDELAEMLAGLGISQREAAEAMARYPEDDAPAAAAEAEEPFFPPYLARRGVDPYAYAASPSSSRAPLGAVWESGPAAAMYPQAAGVPVPPVGGAAREEEAWPAAALYAPPAGVPPRDRGILCTRRGAERRLRGGCAVGPRAERGATVFLPGGALPGGHAHMAPAPPLLPPPPPPLHRGGMAAFHPQAEVAGLFLPEHDEPRLLSLFQEPPETVVACACNLLLMESRHGHRLFRMVLGLCNDELRERIVARITQDKKSFWKICGQRSDEVEALIRSCETLRSMLRLRDAMVPWMAMALDSSRLRLVQVFIQHSPPDIAQFIFEAIANSCTRLACQPNGLSLLQNCLEYVSQQEKDNIFTKISCASLHLAQNSCGNYIVQEVLRSGNPSHYAIIDSCFRYNYVGLSMHKYGSRVVESCLRVFGEGERHKIVYELICYDHFRDLVTHEFANFVLSTAIKICISSSTNFGQGHPFPKRESAQSPLYKNL